MELGIRHTSRASALTYRLILQLVFLFRILFVCRRWYCVTFNCRQGPTVLAVGASRGRSDIFSRFAYRFSFLSTSLCKTTRQTKILSQKAVPYSITNQPTNQSCFCLSFISHPPANKTNVQTLPFLFFFFFIFLKSLPLEKVCNFIIFFLNLLSY